MRKEVQPVKKYPTPKRHLEENKRSFLPSDIPTPELHQLLVGTIAPRPIAFVSTVDEAGNPNLAPYSFFNVFSSNPPTMVFSSNRKVSDNTTKDTLHNVQKTGEAVINVVSYDIVRQMAVASVAFPSDVSEFEKSGLTPLPSDIVKPYRVKEAPVNYECKVKDIITLGDKGGAGHLVICEVVKVHASEHIYDDEGRVSPEELDVMGRMGRAFYTRAKDGVSKIFQAVGKITIGYDQLPEIAKQSKILTGNDLGKMAGLTAFPSEKMTAQVDEEIIRKNTVQRAGQLEKWAKELLDVDAVEKALAVLIEAEKRK